MSSHTFHPSHRETFLEELQELAQELKCHGHMQGTPALPKAKKSTLSLNQILRIQLMMHPVDRMKLSLELGANPNYKAHNKSQLDVATAYAKLYGDPEMVNLLEEYGATLPKKNRAKKST